MNIVVLNGSPKGDYSVTLQTVLYLQKIHPECAFTVVNVGQRIRALERDMSEVLSVINAADLLLFCYPVYTFLAPSQLHRFIELLKEHTPALSGKFATQLTTSKHFYDVTAHRYIQDNCADLGLRFINGLSADMDDLLKPAGQADARAFFEYVRFCVEGDVCEPPMPEPAPEPAPEPEPARTPPVALRPQPTATSDKPGNPNTPNKSDKYDVVIVTDQREGDSALERLTERFRAVFPYSTRVVNIADYRFAGGCLGCFHCAGDGVCVYKDGFDSFLRESIQTASAIVYAFTIRDHSMGARFKLYDDRQFCNGHRTVTMGMPMAYIVNGDYSREPNLRMVIEARCDVGHNFLCGVASDDPGIAALSRRLEYALDHHYLQPRTFYGVGGMKIFRDLIYVMRGLMKADHRFYKQHGIYDFPQKQLGTMLKIKLVGALATNPRVKSKLGNRMNEGMLAPYKKVVDSVR